MQSCSVNSPGYRHNFIAIIAYTLIRLVACAIHTMFTQRSTFDCGMVYEHIAIFAFAFIGRHTMSIQASVIAYGIANVGAVFTQLITSFTLTRVRTNAFAYN